MAANLSTATVDATFNAWWKHYGGTPETIQKALEKTKQQIGPPMPPGYVPPPLRSKAPTTAAPPPPPSVSRTCAMPAGSPFETWPKELMRTLCSSYIAHGPGNRYLANAFWGSEPASFEDALNRLGRECQMFALRWVYRRAAAIVGLWPFVLYIHHLWSTDSHGFGFTCTDKGRLRAFLDSSPSFCRDIPLGMIDHQAHGPTQCWRETVNGADGLHICIPTNDAFDQRTEDGESSMHIDPHQVVVGTDADGTCSYSSIGTIDHLRDVGAGVVKRRAENLWKKLAE